MIDADFQYLAGFLKSTSGHVLSVDKAYLIESRLQPVARRYELSTIGELIARLKLPSAVELRRQVVEAMTINETSFFRDTKPFELFRTIVVPALLQARASSRRLRVWCAASSSGQEPYSLAMMLADDPRLQGWHVEILGTDIDTAILAKASAARYSKFEVQRGLPVQMLLKHFTKVSEDSWELAQAIRNKVTFRQFNLLDDFGSLGVFDAVFCRNVLIYFDPPTKSSILERIHRRLAPDGYLFLGGAETVLGLTGQFAPHAGHRGLYEKSRINAQAA
jgi:chemotaxis protein methyltransferase CheR